MPAPLTIAPQPPGAPAFRFLFCGPSASVLCARCRREPAVASVARDGAHAAGAELLCGQCLQAAVCGGDA